MNYVAFSVSFHHTSMGRTYVLDEWAVQHTYNVTKMIYSGIWNVSVANVLFVLVYFKNLESLAKIVSVKNFENLQFENYLLCTI